MKVKNEILKQLIFLALVISGTIILYSSNIFDNHAILITDNNAFSNSEIKDDKDAEKFFGIFLKNPNSNEGIDALLQSIIYWNQTGKDSSIKSAVGVLESVVKNDLLKNKFYGSLGEYFVANNSNNNSKILEKIIKDYPDSLKRNQL